MTQSSKHTLAQHLDQLDHNEKLVLMFAINANNVLGYQIHMGMLPFVSVVQAWGAAHMQIGIAGPTRHRILAGVREKLLKWGKLNDMSQFAMYLDDAKMARRFGAHPERGHALYQLPKKRVTVGVRWNLPKKVHEPDDDVHVAPHIGLQCLSKGKWLVTCPAKHEWEVRRYLNETCT